MGYYNLTGNNCNYLKQFARRNRQNINKSCAMNKVGDLTEETQRPDESSCSLAGAEPIWVRRPPLITEPPPTEGADLTRGTREMLLEVLSCASAFSMPRGVTY